MAGLPDLCRNDVDINREQATFLNRGHDGFRHGVAITVRHRRHRVFHQIGALLVGLLEPKRVERGLVVVAAPDVMHTTFVAD